MTLPPRLEILAEKGESSRQAAVRLASALTGSEHIDDGPLLEALDAALRDWDDAGIASILDAVAKRMDEGRSISLDQLTGWLDAHRTNPDSAADCILVEPPEQIRVVRRVSQTGSQKVVYEAVWENSQRMVMLKRFLDPETADRLLKRELQPHPLSMEHPNVIETHLLINQAGQPFLVEKRLWQPLSDDWSSRGVREAAALLHDIAAALAFLREEGLIHGDVKPDNIGYDQGRYILLDFGISRQAQDFTADVTATGSVRTRAPELLSDRHGHSYASDIWALGATVLNALTGQFPLIRPSDSPIPRVSNAVERQAFETTLANRVKHEWETYVPQALALVTHSRLRALLASALARDPNGRPSADDLAHGCRTELESLVPTATGPLRDLPRREQLQQLSAYLPHGPLLKLLPIRKAMELRARLGELDTSPTLSEGQDREMLSELRARIGRGD